MKTVQISILFLLSTSLVFGQKNVQNDSASPSTVYQKEESAKIPFFYQFSDFVQPYQRLERGQSVNDGKTWDDPTITIPLGFTMHFFEEEVDTLYLKPIQEGLGLVHDTAIAVAPAILLYDVNLADRALDILPLVGMQGSESPILFDTYGEEGSRTCIIEFRNAGFQADVYDNYQSVDHVTFQIRLIEGEDIIELHMGSHEISQPVLAYDGHPGPSIGLVPSYDRVMDQMLQPAIWLTGMSHMPMPTVSLGKEYLSGHIPANAVYRFDWEARGGQDTTATPTSIVSEFETFHAFPNPAKDYVQIQWEDAQGALTASVWNIQGQKVMAQQIQGDLKVADLMPGVYILECQDASRSVRWKFIKE